jgi:hypothetical protein
MAWNEPGRNRNPWGNRPGQGPNDLDEALRNLQRKLSAMFGGGKSGGGVPDDVKEEIRRAAATSRPMPAGAAGGR